MASLNINSGVSDQFYRYKMPRIVAKVEGKGNGIKTVIVNMTEVAKALSRPPTYPTKFFGCELGAQTNFDIKHDRYIVNGSHDAIKLQQLLDGFIQKFVICKKCNNPETNLIVKKSTIAQRCIACGHNGQVDMTHKLTTFILKNPPDVDASATPSKKERKAQKKESGKRDSKEDASPETNGTSEGNVQEQVAAQRASGADVAAPPPPKHAEEDDDEDWGDAITEDAVKQRREELNISAAVKNLTCNDDLDKTPQQRLEIFNAYIKDKKLNGVLNGSEKDIVAEAEQLEDKKLNGMLKGYEKDIVAEADRLDVRDRCSILFVELLFTDRIVAQIKEYRALLLRFCVNNHKAQRQILGGLEILVSGVYKSLMSKMPNILKTFYDLDIIEEEIIIEWDTKPNKKFVSKEVGQEIREKAAPFLQWLKEAEEEDSDEEEDGMQVAFSVSGKVGEQEIEEENQKDKDEEDDLDIDDI